MCIPSLLKKVEVLAVGTSIIYLLTNNSCEIVFYEAIRSIADSELNETISILNNQIEMIQDKNTGNSKVEGRKNLPIVALIRTSVTGESKLIHKKNA